MVVDVALVVLPRLVVLPQLRKSTKEIILCPYNGFGARRGFFLLFLFFLGGERRFKFIDHHIFPKKNLQIKFFPEQSVDSIHPNTWIGNERCWQRKPQAVFCV